ncbi:MAG: hypothetical protein H6739_01255 [Alphaproteobacteria bacterium]|nr:hypothetical protein [Alphaproteobacteria bacterium]
MRAHVRISQNQPRVIGTERALYRGHRITCLVDGTRHELRIDGRPVPVLAMAPANYRSWLLPRESFGSLRQLGEAIVRRYYGPGNPISPDEDPSGVFELPDYT